MIKVNNTISNIVVFRSQTVSALKENVLCGTKELEENKVNIVNVIQYNFL